MSIGQISNRTDILFKAGVFAPLYSHHKARFSPFGRRMMVQSRDTTRCGFQCTKVYEITRKTVTSAKVPTYPTPPKSFQKVGVFLLSMFCAENEESCKLSFLLVHMCFRFFFLERCAETMRSIEPPSSRSRREQHRYVLFHRARQEEPLEKWAGRDVLTSRSGDNPRIKKFVREKLLEPLLGSPCWLPSLEPTPSPLNVDTHVISPISSTNPNHENMSNGLTCTVWSVFFFFFRIDCTVQLVCSSVLPLQMGLQSIHVEQFCCYYHQDPHQELFCSKLTWAHFPIVLSVQKLSRNMCNLR